MRLAICDPKWRASKKASFSGSECGPNSGPVKRTLMVYKMISLKWTPQSFRELDMQTMRTSNHLPNSLSPLWSENDLCTSLSTAEAFGDQMNLEMLPR